MYSNPSTAAALSPGPSTDRCIAGNEKEATTPASPALCSPPVPPSQNQTAPWKPLKKFSPSSTNTPPEMEAQTHTDFGMREIICDFGLSEILVFFGLSRKNVGAPCLAFETWDCDNRPVPYSSLLCLEWI